MFGCEEASDYVTLPLPWCVYRVGDRHAGYAKGGLYSCDCITGVYKTVQFSLLGEKD